GIEATRRGVNYLMIKKGCLVNSLYRFPTNMTFFSTSERLEIGNVPFIAHGFKPVRREALEYYRRVKEHWNLNVNIYEKVHSVKDMDIGFRVETDKSAYSAKNIIIATGYYDNPNLMNVPGEDLPKVKHYFDEPHPYAYQKVAVIGAGNSAVDVALETFRRSAMVTLIVREPTLKPGIKYWVRPDIENRIKEGSIKAYFNTVVTEIRKKEIDIRTPDGTETLENDFVFAMTGYHPDYGFLENMGIKISQDEERQPFYNPETFETNRKGIYLAGVVCGGMRTDKFLIENSHEQPIKIFNHIAKKK
ncbi:MAG: YpdA family putative bacillithiol disulfide reductase, partial [Calditrichia bacterium]